MQYNYSVLSGVLYLHKNDHQSGEPCYECVIHFREEGGQLVGVMWVSVKTYITVCNALFAVFLF